MTPRCARPLLFFAVFLGSFGRVYPFDPWSAYPPVLAPWLPSLHNIILHAGRAEQISAKARMAYRAVADDIDERGLTGTQSTFKGRTKFLRPLDVLAMTIHELEHPIVTLIR